MVELSASAIRWLGIGVLLAVAGALIKFRGWTFLVAGYDETSAVPEEVVADVAGSTVLRVGLAALALGVLTAVTELPSYLPLLVQAIILLAVVRMIYRLYTYTPETT